MKFSIVKKIKTKDKNYVLPSEGLKSCQKINNSEVIRKIKFDKTNSETFEETGYIVPPMKGFSPKEKIDGSKIIVHSEFIEPLGLKVLEEYEHDDPEFLAILESPEWKREEDIEAEMFEKDILK